MNLPINLIVRKENVKARRAAMLDRACVIALPFVGIVFVVIFMSAPWK